MALTVAVGLGASAWSSTAHAAEPGAEYQPELGKTRFGTPRLAWSMAPPIHLQPERARLMLALPPEWMPQTDPGVLRIVIPTTKDWDIERNKISATATVGSRVHLHLAVPHRSLDFNLSLMPRGAIAVLRFDPVSWTE